MLGNCLVMLMERYVLQNRSGKVQGGFKRCEKVVEDMKRDRMVWCIELWFLKRYV